MKVDGSNMEFQLPNFTVRIRAADKLVLASLGATPAMTVPGPGGQPMINADTIRLLEAVFKHKVIESSSAKACLYRPGCLSIPLGCSRVVCADADISAAAVS